LKEIGQKRDQIFDILSKQSLNLFINDLLDIILKSQNSKLLPPTIVKELLHTYYSKNIQSEESLKIILKTSLILEKDIANALLDSYGLSNI
jgi:hypothetical protein